MIKGSRENQFTVGAVKTEKGRTVIGREKSVLSFFINRCGCKSPEKQAGRMDDRPAGTRGQL